MSSYCFASPKARAWFTLKGFESPFPARERIVYPWAVAQFSSSAALPG